MVCDVSYTIDTRAIDPLGHCRPSALLGYLQEGATVAAAQIHATREEMMEKYGVFWMLARVWYELSEPLLWDDRLDIRTWHRGGKGATFYRDFDLYRNGKQVGQAVSAWVLADLKTHKLNRVDRFKELVEESGGELCKDILLRKIQPPDQMDLVEARRLHYSDADINGHVNNNRYADFMCDALDLETLEKGRFVSALQLGYLAECRPGDLLNLFVGGERGRRFVRGLDSEGDPRFDGWLETASL